MKSIYLGHIFAVAVAALLSTNACGQNYSSDIRLHRTANAISVAPATPSDSAFPEFNPKGNREASDGASPNAQSKMTAPALTVTSSLAVVLGLFAGLIWLTRKFGSRSMHQGAVPKEVLSSLGSTPIDPRTRVTLLRCGRRILVVAQTASGLHPLSEITDPDEVRELTATCLSDSKRTFHTTLESIEKEPSEQGFVAPSSQSPSSSARSSGRLFATA